MADETRKGLVPEGWKKQGVVVPDTVWKSLRTQADDRGHGSMKVLATAGLGLIAGMPEHTRTLLAKWIIQANYDGAAHITPEAIYTEFLRLSRADMGNAVVLGPVTQVPDDPRQSRVSAETAKAMAERLKRAPSEKPLPSEMSHEVSRVAESNDAKTKRRGAA